MSSPLLRQLCEEWVTLNESPRTAAAVSRWAEQHDAFTGLSTPGAIVDHIDRSTRPVKDGLVRALLELLHDGDQLAGRVLLQAMLPCLTDLAGRTRSQRREAGYEENLQRALAEFWAVISRPRRLDKPGVAARLWLDTLNRVTEHTRSRDAWERTQLDHEVCTTENTAGQEQESSAVDLVGVAGELDPDAGLEQLLVWACRSGVLTVDDGRFLAQVFLSGDVDQKQTAERLGLSHAMVRKRVSRLRHALVDAVVGEVSPTPDAVGLQLAS
ncbi:hypothetical protein [Nocardioides sp.]|uniref:hypothetical protein n=1 Tax=Nocardioides sp. TaxID=35761 RepID=UPI0027338F0E|nr:hypothetical protein [Nocardioides sp.]MDP3893619.1 hypothetical protein [Nocardioides sp.]